MKQKHEEAIGLLKQLIATESFSKTENKTADAINAFFEQKGIGTGRLMNNVWVKNRHYHHSKPTLLLNSHHDTVKPNAQYTKDPFLPEVKAGKLYGLGSNDAGGALVALLTCFLEFYNRSDLNFNLIYAATAEEEISGRNGIELLLPHLGNLSFGIVGEPTQMQIAVAEKGLMVIECEAKGISGHAAREEGKNAIYEAMRDLEWFRTFQFPDVSPTLGPVKMTVSMIRAGLQHNIVPDSCAFTVDVRTTDRYSNAQVLDIIKANTSCDILPRSLRLNPSAIEPTHPLVRAGVQIGRSLYGSPTTSDQALMNFPTIKMGPGDSARSHTADEFILIREVEEGIGLYIRLLNTLNDLL